MKLKKVLLTINIIIIISIIAFLTFKFFTKNNNKDNSSPKYITPKTILYKGITYDYIDIVNCYLSKEVDENDTLVIEGEENSWYAFIHRFDKEYVELNKEYLDIYNTYDNLQARLIELDYDVSNVKVIDIDNYQVVAMNQNIDDHKAFIIYSEINNNLYEITMYTNDNFETLNETDVKEILDILSTGK